MAVPMEALQGAIRNFFRGGYQASIECNYTCEDFGILVNAIGNPASFWVTGDPQMWGDTEKIGI